MVSTERMFYILECAKRSHPKCVAELDRVYRNYRRGLYSVSDVVKAVNQIIADDV